MSYLMFWPTFLMAGSVKKGESLFNTSSSGREAGAFAPGPTGMYHASRGLTAMERPTSSARSGSVPVVSVSNTKAGDFLRFFSNSLKSSRFFTSR